MRKLEEDDIYEKTGNRISNGNTDGCIHDSMQRRIQD